MAKKLSKILWHDTKVDGAGKPVLPSVATDDKGLNGLLPGELFMHVGKEKVSLWALSLSGEVVEVSGKAGEVDIDLSDYLLKSVWDSVFEIKTDVSGQKYIFGKLPVVTKYGITMYADDGNVDIPQLAEGLPFDQRTIWFNPDTKQIEVIGGTGGGEGGVSNFWDLSGIPSWITNTKPVYNYSEIQNTPDLSGYATTSSLNAVSTKLNDFLEGSDTDTVINKWKELETFLSGLTESDNLATILTGKADKSYVDTNFVTIAGNEDVTGLHNFVNGLKVGGIELIQKNGNAFLKGNLVVEGGITMYGDGDGGSSVPLYSTLGSLLNVDESNDSVASVDRVLFQSAGSNVWSWKPLSEIGGGSSGGGSVSGAVRYLSTLGSTGSWYDSTYRLYGEWGLHDRLYLKTEGGCDVVANLAEKDGNGNVIASTYLPLSGGTKLIFLTNQYYPDSNFAINLNNSDLIGVNTIYFDDTCNTAGEGLRFPRSNGNYDTLRVEDGMVKLTRNEPLRTGNASYEELWHSGNFNPKKLISWYGNSIDGENTLRPTSANSIYIDKSLRYYLATSSMETGKPMADGMILHLAWDNTGWNSQLYIPNSYAASMQYRTAVDGQATTWADWISVIDSKGGKIDGDLTIQSIVFQEINEINSINNYKLHLNYRVPTDVSICVGGGNVGIGNSNPTEKVDILNNKSSTNTFIHTKRNDTGYGISFGIGSGGVNRGIYDDNLNKWIIYADSTKTNLTENIWINQSEWDNGLRLNRTINSAGCGISIYSNGTKIGVVGINGSQQLEFSIYSNNVNNQRFTVDKNGNGLFWGGITMYSDQRKKTILNHVELSLKQIADAPLIEHYYNSDQDKTTHVGSIAQYWAGMNDWFCKLDNEGFYTMEIQNCALASAISIARELVKYESKTDRTIRKMKQRIQELEDEVERLKKGA